MGASSSDKKRKRKLKMEEDIKKLNQLKTQIFESLNKIEIEITKNENEIIVRERQIKQGEEYLRRKQYSYSKQEKISFVKDLLQIKNDIKRFQKKLDLLFAYKENFKNNISMIESKIQEIELNNQLMNQIEEMNQIKGNNLEINLEKNIEDIIEQKKKDEEQLIILQKGNNAINSDLGFDNPEDYLKLILGNNGTFGNPYSF